MQFEILLVFILFKFKNVPTFLEFRLYVPAAQLVEHGASNTKVMGSKDPQ